MDDTYFTIAKEGNGKVTEKMSRFLSFAFHIDSAQQAKEIIKKYQNLYHDSRHVCWAYMIGAERNEWQLNDNGEPSGTAGKPILGQINSLELSDVLVIVVRYFGGIKLGTPGLIAAYRQAAREALLDAGKRECIRRQNIEINFPYMAMNVVLRIIKARADAIDVLNRQFDNSCSMMLSIRLAEFQNIAQSLLALDGVTLKE